MKRWFKEDAHDEPLLGWCRACSRPVLANPTHWEKDKLAFLCLQRTFDDRISGDFDVSVCQQPLIILDDQAAADAAYKLGGWNAVKAMAISQLLAQEPPGGRPQS